MNKSDFIRFLPVTRGNIFVEIKSSYAFGQNRTSGFTIAYDNELLISFIFYMEVPKVLIIEDKDLYAASLASQFQKWGFRVQVLPDFNQADSSVYSEMPGLVVANANQKKKKTTA